MSTTVKQLLAAKGHPTIASIKPDATVLDALRLMAEKNIGAVLVMDGDKLLGLFSERDYARHVILEGRTSAGTQIAEIMTSKVLYVGLDSNTDQCMQIMTDKHIRHLPVLEQDKVLGMVSIGDIVKATLTEQAVTIEQLTRYIHQ